jgi:hypothetical protein
MKFDFLRGVSGRRIDDRGLRIEDEVISIQYSVRFRQGTRTRKGPSTGSGFLRSGSLRQEFKQAAAEGAEKVGKRDDWGLFIIHWALG